MLYAQAYNDLVESGNTIHLSIHSLRKITTSGEIENLTYNRQPLPPYPELRDDFRPLLNKTIKDIFDSSQPFKQCTDIDNCKYCKFTQVCGRVIAEKKFNA